MLCPACSGIGASSSSVVIVAVLLHQPETADHRYGANSSQENSILLGSSDVLDNDTHGKIYHSARTPACVMDMVSHVCFYRGAARGAGSTIICKRPHQR